jgi:hypothetical protein
LRPGAFPRGGIVFTVSEIFRPVLGLFSKKVFVGSATTVLSVQPLNDRWVKASTRQFVDAGTAFALPDLERGLESLPAERRTKQAPVQLAVVHEQGTGGSIWIDAGIWIDVVGRLAH